MSCCCALGVLTYLCAVSMSARAANARQHAVVSKGLQRYCPGINGMCITVSPRHHFSGMSESAPAQGSCCGASWSCYYKALWPNGESIHIL